MKTLVRQGVHGTLVQIAKVKFLLTRDPAARILRRGNPPPMHITERGFHIDIDAGANAVAVNPLVGSGIFAIRKVAGTVQEFFAIERQKLHPIEQRGIEGRQFERDESRHVWHANLVDDPVSWSSKEVHGGQHNGHFKQGQVR